MEIKKGKITEKGKIEETKNGAHLLHVSVQIGVTKTYNRYTGAEEEAKEEVDYTFWHDDARDAEVNVNVGDVVELEIDHYVDKQWHRTNVITRNLKVLKRADGQPASAKEAAMKKQAEKTAEAEAKGETLDDLPF